MTARRRTGRSAKIAPRDARQVELLPDIEAEVPPGEIEESIEPSTAEEEAAAGEPDIVALPDATSNVYVSSPAADPAPAVPEPLRPAGEKLARARELVEGGRIQEAIALFLEVLERNPASLKAHNNLGVLFDELKQHDSALEHFEQAERVEPENVEVLTNYGSTLAAVGRYEQAEVILRRAQRLAPDDARVRLATGILSFRRGTYAQAEAELGWVCDRDPGNGAAFYYRGEALNRLGRFEEAAVDMGRASSLMPNDPRPVYTLGHLLDRRGLHAESAEMYRRARELQG